MNFVAAAVILILFIAIQGVPQATLTLDEVVDGAPAAAAGLVVGDTLVGADGKTWSTWDEASAYFRANPGKTIALSYRPAGGGPERTVSVTLVENPQAPGSGYLGVRAGVTRDRPGPVEAVKLGLTGFKDLVVGMLTGFWWLLSGKISATGPDGAVGPVGIIDVSRQAVRAELVPDPAGLPELQPRPHQPAAHPAVRRRAHRHERGREDPRPATGHAWSSSAWSPSAPCCS